MVRRGTASGAQAEEPFASEKFKTAKDLLGKRLVKKVSGSKYRMLGIHKRRKKLDAATKRQVKKTHRKGAPLLNLPIEILTMIMKEAYPEVGVQFWEQKKGVTPASIIFTCKTLYHTYRPVALERCAFRIEDFGTKHHRMTLEGRGIQFLKESSM